LTSFNAMVQSKNNKYASGEDRYGSGENKYASGEDTRHINMTQLDSRMANMGWCVYIHAYTHTHKYASGEDTKDINMNQPHEWSMWMVCVCFVCGYQTPAEVDRQIKVCVCARACVRKPP
jgi:hypothetical protein